MKIYEIQISVLEQMYHLFTIFNGYSSRVEYLVATETVCRINLKQLSLVFKAQYS